MECDAGKLIVKHTQKLADYTVDMETDACKVNLDRETYSGWQEGSFGAKNADKHIDIDEMPEVLLFPSNNRRKR